MFFKYLANIFVGLVLFLSVVHAQSDLKFTADVIIQDFIPQDKSGLNRTSPVSTMWYEYNQGTGAQKIRYDIPLPGGILTEFYRYEGFQIRWTLCRDTCTWQDIYYEHFPTISMAPGVGPSSSSVPETLLDGTDVTVDKYSMDGGETELWLESGTDEPVFVEWWDTEPWVDRRRIVSLIPGSFSTAFFDSDETFSPSAYFDPQGALDPICVDVDPRCYRVDLMVVFDGSGSVASQWSKEVLFGYNVVSNLRVEPGWTQAGYQVFRTKAFDKDSETKGIGDAGCCRPEYPESAELKLTAGEIKEAFWMLTGNGTITSRPWSGSSGNPWESYPYTSIIDGIRKGLREIEANGRTFANAVLLVITDGIGNRPCSTPEEFGVLDGYYAGGMDIDPEKNVSIYRHFLIGDENIDCSPLHDVHVVDLYNSKVGQPWYPPTAFAIGVGNVQVGTLETIVEVEPGVTDPTGRHFSVDSFDALDNILDDILALFLCELPGRAKCPKDCLPGGYCCAGGCICADDCAQLLGTDCQEGLCVVSQSGTSCQHGDPNDGSCFDGDPCTDDICVDAVGCSNPEIAENGPCDDGNGCTENDVCVNRVCTGTPIPEEPANTTDSACSDNNLCTQDHCNALGECISVTIEGLECDFDEDPEDCIVPFCDPGTGACATRELEVNEVCLFTEPDDCDVYICVEKGGEKECKKRTRNLSKCEDDESVPVGAIVGAVLAFVALVLAVCCILFLLIILIALLVMMAKSGAEAAAIIGGFGANIEVSNSPIFEEAKVFTDNVLAG